MSARSAALAACLVAALLLTSGGAWAHANYLSSEPARGQRLDAAPGQVTVTLSETIDPSGSTLEVRDAGGARVDDGRVVATGGDTPTLTVGVPGLADGAYTATWKALSTVDGHVTKGSWGFAVGAFDAPAVAEPPDPVPYLSAASRALLYLGFALGFGSLATVLAVDPRPRPAERTVRLLHLLATGAVLQCVGVALLALDTLLQSGASATRFFAGTAVGRDLTQRAAVALVAIPVALGLVARRSENGFGLAAVSLLFLGSAWGSASFAHSSQEGAWAVAVDLLHLLSAATWLGGLGMFLLFLVHVARRGDPTEVPVVGQRFSRVALTSVVVLAATGVVSAVLIVGPGWLRDPLSLADSRYGGFLAGKILLAAAMVGVAGVNRFVFLGHRPGRDTLPFGVGPDVLQPPNWRDMPSQEGRRRAVHFRRTVAAEAALGLTVLVLAGFLTAVSPPAPGLGADGADELRATGQGENFHVTFVATPTPSTGTTANVSVLVRQVADGAPVEEAVRVRVEITFADDPDAGGAAFPTSGGEGGRWVVGDVLFARAGNYTADVTVQTQEVFREVVRVAFRVEAP